MNIYANALNPFMLRSIALLTLLLIPFLCFSQSLEERAYREVIEDGPSTAPGILVINVKDSKTGQTKEICTDVTSLYWSLQNEFPHLTDADLKKELLNHAEGRMFTFKKTEALVRLNFYKYQLKDEIAISKTIKQRHLIDSLSYMIELKDSLSKRFYAYSEQRDSILKEISDSIKVSRPLTEEETKMINNLRDQYYDEYYNNTKFDSYRKISSLGIHLMNTWNHNIKPYKTDYDNASQEVARLNLKFFKRYINKYGLSFCHVAFKNGIMSYFGDDNPGIYFSMITK
ncbi:hypothetical protein [Mucilaginibacter gynuensis]|uniref:hypothetical protein n=1 Tax=Mucilaginibacter gynuensis TaxID=1302236 RepID=UPI0031EF5483